MKVLIPILIGLLVGGCGESKEEQSTETDENSNTPEKPVKELTAEEQKALRDSVVGEYEWKNKFGITIKTVYLDNGIREHYIMPNAGKTEDKWYISKGEIHVKTDSGVIDIYRINTDKSITMIAFIENGNRRDLP
ncbi:MAG: hypothetical protein VX945_01200, partial [Verrucomicrobiota bacterium]|nr:hypothetical protein [Verrucomicrobiota bacterium]